MGLRSILLLVCLGMPAMAVAVDSSESDTTSVVPQGTPRQESIADLDHLVDLWHDANLKGDGRMIRKGEQNIIAFVSGDIRRTQWHYEVYRKRLENAQASQAASSAEQRQLVNDLAAVDQWIKVKKRLLQGFERSTAFSNKYRLLGDYLQILRLEFDQVQVKMAESDDSDESDTDNAEGENK